MKTSGPFQKSSGPQVGLRAHVEKHCFKALSAAIYVSLIINNSVTALDIGIVARFFTIHVSQLYLQTPVR